MDQAIQDRIDVLKSDLLKIGYSDDYNTAVFIEDDYDKKLKSLDLYDRFLADLTALLASPQARERILSTIGDKIKALNAALITLRS